MVLTQQMIKIQHSEVNGVKTPLRTTPGIGFEYDDETADSIEIGGKHTLGFKSKIKLGSCSCKLR